jgi:hypothetical protein
LGPVLRTACHPFGHDELRRLHADEGQHSAYITLRVLGSNGSRLRSIQAAASDSDNDALGADSPEYAG